MDKATSTDINLADYTYHLPQDRIARYPLRERDASKLLVYQNGQIAHHVFRDLPGMLGKNDILFFNNTKVLPARIYFEKETGAHIEVFLLHPVAPTPVVAQAMLVNKQATWACTIGNLKRWNEGLELKRKILSSGREVELAATLLDRKQKLVRFTWDNADCNFVDVVQAAGVVPIPPYLNRQAEESDRQDYQTVYSKREGAVAAPTAGLHFTKKVLDELVQKGVQLDELTLHVSAGTFRPVKTEKVQDHEMHKEQIIVKQSNLLSLLGGKRVVVVGTTCIRTLESLYWYGVKLLNNPAEPFFIEKLIAWQHTGGKLPTKEEAFKAVLNKMRQENLEEIIGETEIFIFPGYKFQVCEALVTNYHQPESTLVLLIAAFVGKDWKKIYQGALDNSYRFLSYGDSSLLFKND